MCNPRISSLGRSNHNEYCAFTNRYRHPGSIYAIKAGVASVIPPSDSPTAANPSEKKWSGNGTPDVRDDNKPGLPWPDAISPPIGLDSSVFTHAPPSMKVIPFKPF